MIPFLTTCADIHKEQVKYKAIQDKCEYRNLFDTCINNKKKFEDIREGSEDTYVDSLNVGSSLLNKAFKEFIKRHTNDVLTYTRFRELKGLAYAYSLIHAKDIRERDYSPMTIFDHIDSLFAIAFKEALVKDGGQMMTNLQELSDISQIFKNEIELMPIYYRTKDRGGTKFLNKDIESSLRRFCKYAYLVNACYLKIKK
jgi:hypothetical protein